MATYIIAPSGGDYTTFAAMVAAITLTGNDVVEFRAAALGGSATFNERCALDGGGTAGNTVKIRGRYGDSITVRGFNGGGFDYVDLSNINIEHTSSSNNYSQALLTNCTNWTFDNVAFRASYQSAVTGTSTSDLTFRFCSFNDTSYIDGGSQEGQVINIKGDDILFEYCTFGRTIDRIRAWGDNIRARNCYFGATDTTDFPDTVSQVPAHIDDFQVYENGGTNLTQFLMDACWSEDNTDSVGGTNGHWTNMQDDDDTGFSHHVFRFCVVTRMAGSLFDFQNCYHVHIFNNTFVKINNGSISNFRTTGVWDLDTGAPQNSDVADVRNNFWYNCPRCQDTKSLLSSDWRPTNFVHDSNGAYNPTGNQCVLMSSPATGNLTQEDPEFDDPDNDDYSLGASSPLINAGTSEIVSVGAGSSSTSLTVNNAKKIWAGDLIKIGSGSFIRVSSVNYSTNVITIPSSSWSDAETVIVKGMEDVGACPRSYYDEAVTISIDNTSLPAGSVDLEATVSNTHAVRKVVWKVDGIYVGESADSPYTVAYTADGESHLVKAILCKQWASPTPTVETEVELLAASVYRAGGFLLTAS